MYGAQDIVIATVFLVITGTGVAAETRYYDIYAPPGVYGAYTTIQSCFGASVNLRWSIKESHVKAPVVWKAWTSETKQEYGTSPGQTLEGQVVQIKAKSLGTGGPIKIKVVSSC